MDIYPIEKTTLKRTEKVKSARSVSKSQAPSFIEALFGVGSVSGASAASDPAEPYAISGLTDKSPVESVHVDIGNSDATEAELRAGLYLGAKAKGVQVRPPRLDSPAAVAYRAKEAPKIDEKHAVKERFIKENQLEKLSPIERRMSIFMRTSDVTDTTQLRIVKLMQELYLAEVISRDIALSLLSIMPSRDATYSTMRRNWLEHFETKYTDMLTGSKERHALEAHAHMVAMLSAAAEVQEAMREVKREV